MTLEVRCEKLLCRSLLGMFLLVSPMMAQNYLGSSTYLNPGPAATTQLVMNLTISGTSITGAIGIGTVTATISVSGTRNGQSCTVGAAGGLTYSGTCTATSFAGTYRVGAQSGTFSVTANGTGATAWAAPAAATAAVPAAAAPAAVATPEHAAANAVAAGAPAPANNGVVSWLAAPPGTAPAPLAAPAPVAAHPPVVVRTVGPTPMVAPITAPPATPGPAPAPPAIAANGVVGWLAAPPQATPPPPVEIPWLAATPGPAQGATPLGTGKQTAVPPVPAPAPKWNPPLPPTPPVPGPVPPVGGMTCPASGTAQIYRGTIFAAGAREAVTFNVVFQGGAASGTMGIAQDGTIAATPNQVTGTLNGQHCRLTPGGLDQGAVFEGTCDGRTFSGTESIQGTSSSFTTSLVAGGANAVTTQCGGTVVPPPPVPPVPPIGVTTCPTGQKETQLYKGTLSDGSLGQIAFNLTVQGGAITGALGIGAANVALYINSSVTGTVNGQHCTLTAQGGEVFDGTCTGATFNGIDHSASGPTPFTTSLQSTVCSTGVQPAPTPVPVPAPVTCSATQLYQGAVYLPSGQQERLAMNMTFAGGNITGLMGKGPAGPLPVPVDPLTGTMTGQHCTVTLGGANAGSVLDGSCDGHVFAGTYVSNGVTMEFTVGTQPPVPAGCFALAAPGPVPVPTPVPGPVPAPTPFPKPTPPVIRYCGTFTNTSVPFTGAFQMVLVTPNSFQGSTLLIGQPLTPTVGADFGGGGMTGDWASCSGVSDAGFRFLPGATCTATTMSGHYSIPVGDGFQDGTFSSTATTADACPQLQ